MSMLEGSQSTYMRVWNRQPSRIQIADVVRALVKCSFRTIDNSGIRDKNATNRSASVFESNCRVVLTFVSILYEMKYPHGPIFVG